VGPSLKDNGVNRPRVKRERISLCAYRPTVWVRYPQMVAEHAQLTRRPWAVFAALLGFGMLAVYVTLIVSEGGNSISDIAPWVLVMAIPVALASLAVVVQEMRTARGLLVCAGALFGIIGALSILTIGIGFLLAATAAFFAATSIPT